MTRTRASWRWTPLATAARRRGAVGPTPEFSRARSVLTGNSYIKLFSSLQICFKFLVTVPLLRSVSEERGPPVVLQGEVQITHCLVGDSGTVLRARSGGGEQEGGTVRRGRRGEVGGGEVKTVEVKAVEARGGEAAVSRRHSRASSLDRREIYQKYIHTDRYVALCQEAVLCQAAVLCIVVRCIMVQCGASLCGESWCVISGSTWRSSM